MSSIQLERWLARRSIPSSANCVNCCRCSRPAIPTYHGTCWGSALSSLPIYTLLYRHPAVVLWAKLRHSNGTYRRQEWHILSLFPIQPNDPSRALAVGAKMTKPRIVDTPTPCRKLPFFISVHFRFIRTRLLKNLCR